MTRGFETIIPFLRPLEPLLLDPEVSEVMRNGDGLVFVERRGRLSPMDMVLEEASTIMALQHVARKLMDAEFSAQLPLLDASLPDGSRLSARWPGISRPGVSFNIRKFDNKRYSMEELIRSDSVDEQLAGELKYIVSSGKNLLIGGGTSTGKTTLLNALSPFMGECRVVVIEDTPELSLHQSNVDYWTARKAMDGVPAVTIRDLIRMAKRARPDRIIVGEVRGGEAVDLIDALSSGHGGSMATIHAGSPNECLVKLALCMLQAGEVSETAVNRLIAMAIDHVVTLVRANNGKRFVQQLVAVTGWDEHTGMFTLDYGDEG